MIEINKAQIDNLNFYYNMRLDMLNKSDDMLNTALEMARINTMRDIITILRLNEYIEIKEDNSIVKES